MALTSTPKTIGFNLYNLSEDRVNNEELFEELQNTTGTRKAEIREKIIKHNVGLVRYIVNQRFPYLNTVCQAYRVTPDEVLNAGMFGMLKAMDSFDISKEYKFATYASMCIHNELSMFMRSHKKYKVTDSYEEPIATDSTGNTLTILDLLVDDDNPLDSFFNREDIYKILRELEKKLKPRDLNMLQLYIEGEITQGEIAEIMMLSQSYVSRRLKYVADQAKKIYERMGGDTNVKSKSIV